MKIAVASETDMVTGHFGHCTNFNIFDTEGSKIIQGRLYNEVEQLIKK